MTALQEIRQDSGLNSGEGKANGIRVVTGVWHAEDKRTHLSFEMDCRPQ